MISIIQLVSSGVLTALAYLDYYLHPEGNGVAHFIAKLFLLTICFLLIA